MSLDNVRTGVGNPWERIDLLERTLRAVIPERRLGCLCDRCCEEIIVGAKHSTHREVGDIARIADLADHNATLLLGLDTSPTPEETRPADMFKIKDDRPPDPPGRLDPRMKDYG